MCDLKFLQIGSNVLYHLEKQIYQQKFHKVKQPNVHNDEQRFILKYGTWTKHYTK